MESINTVIQNYDLTTEILALKNAKPSWFRSSTQTEPELIRLSKADITCFQLFLKLFECGILANTTTDLATVADYLANDRIVTSLSKDALVHKKICQLAHKALIHRNSETLYNQVSREEKEIDIYIKFRTGYQSGIAKMTFRYNSESTLKHILHIASMHLQGPGTLKLLYPFEPDGDQRTTTNQYDSTTKMTDLAPNSCYISYTLPNNGDCYRTGLFRAEYEGLNIPTIISKISEPFNKTADHPSITYIGPFFS